LLALLVLWGAMLIAIRTAHPGLELGDGLNDADILHASKWFAENGYWGTKFLPVRETAFHPDFWPPTYNTFPPGVFYMHQVQRALGLSELWQFRVVSVLLAMLAVWLWFLVARRLTHSTPIAALAAALYMLARPVIDYAPGFWEHVPMLSLFATLLCWLKHEAARAPRARRIWLLLAALAMFLDSWLTLQHAVMLATIITTRSLLRWWWARREKSGTETTPLRTVLLRATLVCSMPAVVGALRFGQQYLHAGTIENTLAYFKHPIKFRSGSELFTLSRLEVVEVWLHRLGVPDRISQPFRVPHVVVYPVFTGVSLLCLGVLTLLLVRRWHEPGLKPFRLALLSAILLFAGALTWPMMMRQHAYIHTFSVLMFLPSATLALAGACVWGLSLARSSGRFRAGVLAALAIAPLVIPISSLAHSATLNRVVRLDSGEHARVRDSAHRLEAIARAGRFLEPDRVLRVVPRWPSVPYMLGRPFYQLVSPLDVRWVVDETTVLDLNHAQTARAAAAMALSAGIPDLMQSPASQGLYPPRMSSADPWTQSRCERVELLPGASLVELRLARSVDRAAVACSLLIDGAVLPREAVRCLLLVEAIDSAGRSTFARSSVLSEFKTRSMGGRIGWRQLSSDPALLAIVELPLVRVQRAQKVRVTLVTPRPEGVYVHEFALPPSFPPAQVPTVPKQ
jgi:hypothetical protein